jgi:hypothetical protein
MASNTPCLDGDDVKMKKKDYDKVFKQKDTCDASYKKSPYNYEYTETGFSLNEYALFELNGINAKIRNKDRPGKDPYNFSYH